MPKRTKKHHPPKKLQGVLWSADVADLDLEENKTYIIHQVLSLGTIEELKWLFRTYPAAVLKKIFVNEPIKVYTPAAFNFSKEVLLGLKNKSLEEVNYVKTFPRNIRPRLKKSLTNTTKTASIDLSAVGDIAADKAHTIGRRGQWRDYVDIFFLLRKNIYTLKEVIKLATQKFRPEFNPRLFLEQLCYYGDIKDFSITFVEESYSIKEIKDYLKDETDKLAKSTFEEK